MSTPPGPQTALIVRVPEAEAAVGALRTRFDPSAALGVPAHITVPHPFMAPDAIDAAVSARIGGIAAATRRFHYRLDTIARFPETLYLAPDPAAPFIALTQALAAAFPDWPPYSGRHAGVVPHLTVAQADASRLDAIESELHSAIGAESITAHCAEIVLIENGSGRWKPMHAFPLGSPATTEGDACLAIADALEGSQTKEQRMASKQGRIVGEVTYREGDGTELVIRPGPCEITVTNLDVTIGWTDGDTRGSTAMPLAEYTRYLTSGAIELAA